MTTNEIKNTYFEWLFDLACGERYSRATSFRKLLTHLHRTDFRYHMLMDGNRAGDGTALRYRFHLVTGLDDDELTGPCSVLEMMIALALRCEETIMDDSDYGDRMGQWFWGMIRNLGLSGSTDDRYDEEKVDYILNRFLDRKYEPNGEGGLFFIRNCDEDLRDVDIWCQLCWYLDSII